VQGFILQPTYRIERGRPVVQLYGVLESGKSFLVRDTRSVPHFWIRAGDADAARRLGALDQLDAPDHSTMRGEPVVRVNVTTPPDVPPLRDRLVATGIECFEADVRFANRFLIERSIRGAVDVDGEAQPGSGVDLLFEDPRIGPGDWSPRLRVLSLDIETDPTASRLLSVALSGCGANEVLLLTPEGFGCPAGATPCSTEHELLQAFVERVRALDPDVLTGWNVVDFDLRVLDRLGQRFGLPLVLGRGREPMRIRPSNAQRAARHDATVQGRLVMDGIDMLRGAFVRLDDYSLNGAAGEILGKQKTITGRDRAGQILAAFNHDRERLVEYNLHDAQLVLEILDQLHLMELSVQRSRLTGLPPDRVAASISAFDFLYLSALSPRGVVAPSVRGDVDFGTPEGGHVLDPAPGLYRNVVVLDFKSLYPSIIRTFQIDPLGFVPGATGGEDLVVAPNGAAFRREPGILPGLLDRLFPQRQAARAAGDGVASHAIKILMNSFYGVLGTSACRFASPALANAITGFGREILLWSRDRIERGGHRVLYGDTDSLFVLADLESSTEARALGRQLVEQLNRELAAHVRAQWDVESRLELEFERLYLRLLLPAVRRGTAGARKRYVGLVESEDGPRVEFTGMEVVRRDWTELARQVQRELYERLFSDRPVDVYLRQVVADLRAGRHDDLLVYRKGLRRRLDSYTASTPPHVAAARKMSGTPGRVIRYVMTRNGPEPAAERRAAIDHEHYVQKQVRAVAEPVLDRLGLDFDAVVGDPHQLRLF
jgi:DNA polymerase-2